MTPHLCTNLKHGFTSTGPCNAVLHQGGRHVYNGILVRDDAGTQLFLNLEDTAAQQSHRELLWAPPLPPHISMASLLLGLGSAVLDQGGRHVYNGILIRDDADTQLLLNLEDTTAQQSHCELLWAPPLPLHMKIPLMTSNSQLQAMMNYNCCKAMSTVSIQEFIRDNHSSSKCTKC